MPANPDFELYHWRHSIASYRGPSKPVTRHILLTLSLFMRAQECVAFPSIDLLAERTGLTERTVRKHLELAVAEGWIARELVTGIKGWPRYVYAARMSAEAYAALPSELPWQGDGSVDNSNTHNWWRKK